MPLNAGIHVGPWTEEDMVGLPEDAQRYELLEGTLLVHPLPSGARPATRWWETTPAFSRSATSRWWSRSCHLGLKTIDRVTKPAVYAAAGIPSFWRVEVEDGPAIFAYRLEQGRYTEVGSARPGEPLVVNDPFPVTMDPGDLRP